MDKEKTLSGLMNMGNFFKEGGMDFRKKAMTTKVKDITINTACPVDTGKWETGICVDKWIIVEQYKDLKEATKGHAKWVKLMKEKPNTKLKDIDLWGLKE